ncbi:MAG: DUF4391 domain-containing protein, partial [Candidatus Delongbacteria bacterium]|nr:DUF4391 domain-containing protein [Candidatus Delongbacteria bacterium]
HPTNENQSVIDWTFRSPWFSVDNIPLKLKLKGSLDDVFNDLCFQISGKKKKSITELIQYEEELKRLKDEVIKLESAIKRSKQFNEKVELNLKLQEVSKKLSHL